MSEPLPPQPPVRAPVIVYPYRGARRSYYCYHPCYHGPSDKEGQWEDSSKRFYDTVDEFCAVAQMYNDEQTRSETVGGPKWRKDVLKMYESIARDDKDVYQLEALGEAVFDRDNKLEQRILPSHEELRQRATLLRHEDLGLSIDGGVVDPRFVVKRSWGT